MNNKFYKTAGYISMCYLLFIIISHLFGWIVMIYSIHSFKKLLREKTRTIVFDRSSNTVIYTIILYLLYVLFAYSAIRAVLPAQAFLVIQYLIVTALGVAFFLLALKLQLLQHNLYNLKGQLMGMMMIVGGCFMLCGIVSSIYAITANTALLGFINLAGMMTAFSPVLLGIIMGRVFLRASKDENIVSSI